MRTWRFHAFGTFADVYRLEECEKPMPGDGEVVIRLQYASLNPADRLLVEGKYPGAGALPLTVGRDGSGVVESAAEGSAFKAGDSVLLLRSGIGITRQGTLAEYVAAPEEIVAPVPEGWSMEEAAAGPLVYLTAWKALVVQGGLQPGENVLVTGATGGVGMAAVQLAKALGANVAAMTRDESKADALIELGADSVIDSNTQDLVADVQQSFGGNADVIIENIAGPTLESHILCSNLNGRIMVIGLLGGRMSEIELGQVLFKQVRIEGVHVGKFSPAEAHAAWDSVVETLGRVDQKPLVDQIFPMDQVQEAFTHLREGHMGKVLVQVDSLNAD
jgi:NADPH:quinone reductase